MIKKLIVLTKIIVYVFVFNLKSNLMLAVEYDEFDCIKIDDITSIIYGSVVNCKSHSNASLFLPVKDIPENTRSLTISTSGNGSLKIIKPDVFHRIKKLKNLEIRLNRSIQIVEELSHSSTSMEYLRKKLFDIPTLDRFVVEYNEFNNKNYSWTLPSSVTTLYLSNGVLEFDISNCSRLVSLQLNRNNLKKLPSFHNPPAASLETLDLRYNPLEEFAIYDIAGFCKLKYFAMDTNYISNCECKRLKQWIGRLKTQRTFTFHGTWNCNDSVDDLPDCTLNEAVKLNADKCSDAWISTETLIAFAAGSSSTAIASIIVCCCCLYCLCSSCLAAMADHPILVPGYAPPYWGVPPAYPGYGIPPYSPYGMPPPAAIPMPMPMPVPMPVPVPVADSTSDFGGGRGGGYRHDHDVSQGGDDTYSGESDTADNAGNDSIFLVVQCMKSSLK